MRESLIDFMLRQLYEYRRMKVETVVNSQHMYPNCEKYKHCCSESWKPTLENVKDVPIPHTNPYQIKIEPKPNDFDKW